MFDLIETAEKIIELVDTHCEPSICKVKDCDKCAEIKRLRNKLGKDGRSGSSRGCKSRYYYIVSKDGKEVAHVNSTYKVAEIIGIAAPHITYMIQNDRPSRGYTVKRYLKDLEEVE